MNWVKYIVYEVSILCDELYNNNNVTITELVAKTLTSCVQALECKVFPTGKGDGRSPLLLAESSFSPTKFSFLFFNFNFHVIT